MFCTNCGTKLEEGTRFCTNCGKPVEGAPEKAAPQQAAPLPTSAQPAPADTTAVMPAQGAAAPVGAAAASSFVAPSNAAAKAAPPAPPQPAQQYQQTPVATLAAHMPATQTSAATPVAPTPAPAAAPAAAAPAQAAGANKGMIIALSIAAAALLLAVAAFLLVNSGVIGGPSSYQVSYETGGGSTVATSQVDVGATLTSPADPVKDGYKFEGWYTDAACTQRVTFPYAPEANTVLYAKWEEAPASSDAKDSGDAAKSESGNTTIIVNPGSNSGTTTQQQPATTTSSSVTVSITGADGTTRTETIRRQGSSQRVFPDSNTRRLSTSEVAALTDAERCIAWNEIIAASNGYMFKNSGLASYFNSCSWYSPNPSAGGGGSLSAEASDNVNLLKSYTSDWWQHLATN